MDRTPGAVAQDVAVDAEGGRSPHYTEDWADVDVSTSERTITVPVVKVETETRQVTVPHLDINPPGARGRAQQVLSLEVTVPHAGYELQVVEIRASGDDLWVIGRLRETGPPSAHVVTRLSD